ncbi:MAG TPA: glutathione S-transferase family protein [Alphaproteobacteria bacterium]|nr:glutathione S-transferase family protein [Alphaproteobacteria bacterium]
MPARTLVIGNKAYSSWSLRGWLALKQTGLPFDEILIPLDRPESPAALARYSPSLRVPVLIDGDLRIWETIAIIEHLAELVPEAGLWPRDRTSRAHARAIAAEMHTGFAQLRRDLPMDLKRAPAPRAYPDPVAEEIRRVETIWAECRVAKPTGGPFLFGAFCGADAMFAPVATRLRSYAVPISAVSADYCDALFDHPPMRDWVAAGRAEPWIIEYPRP